MCLSHALMSFRAMHERGRRAVTSVELIAQYQRDHAV